MNLHRRTAENMKRSDRFCFECHREGDLFNCDSCSRVYHGKCLRLNSIPPKNWTCPECENTQSSFNIITQSHSIDELHLMLTYALQRVKSHSQAQSFLHFIDTNKNLVHPMDLQQIERNLSRKKYHSTGMFLSDMKWILHNSIIVHGEQSRTTQNARTLLKKARHEINEMEICSDCYLRSAQPELIDWFTKPCSIPHVLCWAKMKTYPSWPAKVLRIVNNQVDVRFFGRHDRAWIPYENCWVLSKEYPENKKKKSNIHFDRSLAELQDHIEQLRKFYGSFRYAPTQTLLSQTKPFKFVPIIDNSILPVYMTVGNQRSSRVKSTGKQTSKRVRSTSNSNDDDHQSMLNVFDILNQSEPSTSKRQRIRSISPTDNKYLIQGFLRKYTHIEPFHPDVRSTITKLLDNVETNINEQTTRRKLSCHNQILPCSSLDQHLSPTLPIVPLRPLSVSPTSFEVFPLNIEDSVIPQINQMTDEEEEEMPTVTQSIDTVLIPSSIDETHPLPTIIPCLSPIRQQNIWPDVLSINSHRKSNKTKRTTNQHHEDESPSHPISNEIHTVINTFKDQFEQFLVNLTSRIDSSLRDTQLKYEKDLETIHRSYRTSLNDLHSITAEQVQEMHQNLELQYWQRLSEMRNRYESKLRCTHPLT